MESGRAWAGTLGPLRRPSASTVQPLTQVTCLVAPRALPTTVPRTVALYPEALRGVASFVLRSKAAVVPSGKRTCG